MDGPIPFLLYHECTFPMNARIFTQNARLLVSGGLLALACPFAGRAQQTGGAPRSSWFIGLGGAWGAYLEPGFTPPYEGYGPAFTVGHDVLPRLAVQTGLVFYQRSGLFGFNGTYDAARFNPGGPVLVRTESNVERRRAFAVPLLLRYALTRDPARRWQADALAGATGLQTRYQTVRKVAETTTSGPTFARQVSEQTRTGVNLTAGAGLRHAVSRRLELTADALGHLSLTPRTPVFGPGAGAPYPAPGPVPPLRERLSGTVLLGVRYRFGPAGSALPFPVVAPTRARWYAGLGAGFGRYQLVRDESARRVVSPVPTLGVQLGPRWALQASAAYGQDRSQGTYLYGRKLPSGRQVVAYDAQDTRLRTWAVPLLARYAVDRDPGAPWQVDALAGATAVRATFERTVTTRTDSTAAERPVTQASARTAWLPTVGVGLRYARGPRWAATADVLATRAWEATPGLFAARVWSATATVGVRYALNHP